LSECKDKGKGGNMQKIKNGERDEKEWTARKGQRECKLIICSANLRTFSLSAANPAMRIFKTTKVEVEEEEEEEEEKEKESEKKRGKGEKELQGSYTTLQTGHK
jgi:hypothetical protein